MHTGKDRGVGYECKTGRSIVRLGLPEKISVWSLLIRGAAREADLT